MEAWARWYTYKSKLGGNKTQKRWIFFALHKNLTIMGGGGSIAAPVHKL